MTPADEMGFDNQFEDQLRAIVKEASLQPKLVEDYRIVGLTTAASRDQTSQYTLRIWLFAEAYARRDFLNDPSRICSSRIRCK